jgi:hypothetical protein
MNQVKSHEEWLVRLGNRVDSREQLVQLLDAINNQLKNTAAVTPTVTAGNSGNWISNLCSCFCFSTINQNNTYILPQPPTSFLAGPNLTVADLVAAIEMKLALNKDNSINLEQDYKAADQWLREVLRQQVGYADGLLNGKHLCGKSKRLVHFLLQENKPRFNKSDTHDTDGPSNIQQQQAQTSASAEGVQSDNAAFQV